jgi:hypothetical protein
VELASIPVRNFLRPSFSNQKISLDRGAMSIFRFIAAVALLFAVQAAFAQNLPAHSARANSVASTAADESKEPKLEHFDPNLADKSLDPCDDFYKYSCSKWLTANPIPADQVYWSTGSSLELWNEGVLRETLENASKPDASRTAGQKKIGDYWAACMDESGIEAAGLKPLSLNSHGLRHSSRRKNLLARLREYTVSILERGNRGTIKATPHFSDLPDCRIMTTRPW